MKSFDIELAKQGKPVCTRDGRSVRIVCFDRKDEYPISALVTRTDSTEAIASYDEKGRYYGFEDGDNSYDLVMNTKKHIGYMILCFENDSVSPCALIFNTKEEAIKYSKTIDCRTSIIKITFEE